MSWLDKAFLLGPKAIMLGGVPVPNETALNFKTGFTGADNPANGSYDITATGGGGGGSVPTGTGIPHVVGGVQNAAASLIVDADVSASAAIQQVKLAQATGSGLVHITAGGYDAAAAHGSSPGQIPVVNLGASDVAFVAVSGDATLSSTGALAVTQISNAGAAVAASVTGGLNFPATKFLSMGAIPATAGDIRLSTQAAIKQRNSANSVDLLLMSTNNVDTASLWGTGAAYGNLEVGIGGGAKVRIQTASVFVLNIGAAAIEAAAPIIGNANPWGAVDSTGTQAMADANQTPAAAVYLCSAIKLTSSTMTALRNVTMPAATDAQSYEKSYDNAGNFGVVITSGVGSTITVGAGKIARARIDSTGVRRVTADGVVT